MSGLNNYVDYTTVLLLDGPDTRNSILYDFVDLVCHVPQLIGQVKIGPRFGVGISNFTESIRGNNISESNLDYQARPNYHWGGAASWQLSPKVSLNTDLVLYKIGTALENFPPRHPLKQIQYYNYWSMPIGLSYRFSNAFMLEGGVNFGLYKVTWWKHVAPNYTFVLRSFDNDRARFIKGIQLLAGWQLSDQSILLLEVNPFGTSVLHPNLDGDSKNFRNLQLAFRYQPWTLTAANPKAENRDF